MEKDIRFTGYTSVPSDYECSDGELTQAYNLINEDGAYKSLLAPKVVFNLGENHSVIYVHKATTYTHYIIMDTTNKKLLWTIDGSNFTDLCSIGDKELYQIVGVGNTLIILTDAGMFYFLWKSDTSGYLFLGNDIPKLSLSFGLQGKMERTDKFRIEHKSSAENLKDASSEILAKVNKFIADESTNKGKFLYPFLLRYAYRLYDGSLTMHSAPILMVCSTSCTPIVIYNLMYLKEKSRTADLLVTGMLHQLDYAVINESELNLLKNWSDIVKSVDIFISKPIYTYDQNGECDKIYDKKEFENEDFGYSVCKHINQIVDTDQIPVRYQMRDMIDLYKKTFPYMDNQVGSIVGIPIRDPSIIKKEIRNCSNFYFLKSIKVEQLTTTRTIIDIKEDYLQSLVTREVMTDDYDSHDNLIPKNALVYNSRVNLTNVSKRLFEGFNAASMLPFTDGNVKFTSGKLHTEFDKKIVLSVYIYIRQGGKEIVVHGKAGVLGYGSPVFFIYYPNVNAYKAVLECYDNNDDSRMFYEIPLERHAFLNGVFYFGGFRKIIRNGALCFAEWGKISGRVSPIPTVSNDNERTIDISNKIYTSEINNPFYFPVTGINTVGTGKILGISTAAKALSQGQFGQFPLYAFTDEGVWALEVNSSGGYSAKQPITRDVCISSDSITQIDTAVLFATDRGIMEISGSQTQCLTDIINGNDSFSLDRLPGLSKLYPDGIPQVDCTFSEFRKGSRMSYDYVNQRIIVFNKNKNYAYVFSMKSKLWGIVASSLTTAINSYPNAYAMAKIKTVVSDGKQEVTNNCLVDLSRSAETHQKGLLVTRPIKLDVASMLKTFDTVFLRGLFGKGKVQVVLYGSRDNIRWHLIHSAKEHYLRGFRGTPYKYFRIVAITDLSIGETLVGASVAYTPRLTNQIR